MNWDFSSSSVVLLGAGFSYAATDGAMPLMKGFFSELTQEAYPELFNFVRTVGCNRRCPSMADANVEQVLLAFDQMRTAPQRALSGELATFRGMCEQLRRDFATYTLNRLNSCPGWDSENWAVQLLACIGSKTTVVSMNYDNIAESILANRRGMTHQLPNATCPHCRMRAILQYACSCSVRHEKVDDVWRGAVLKPHGSIAWKQCINADCCQHECLVADEQCRPFEDCNCPYCAETCIPVMILPTMSKDLSQHPEISVMWQAFEHAIAEAETLLIFGFSLPASDELLRQSIREACARGGRLRQVAAIDLDPNAVLDRFEDCLPIGYSIERVELPVVPGDVPIWMPPQLKCSFVSCG